MGSYKESQKLSLTRKNENYCRIMMKSSLVMWTLENLPLGCLSFMAMKKLSGLYPGILIMGAFFLKLGNFWLVQYNEGLFLKIGFFLLFGNEISGLSC